jgi:hypothetical protein
MDAADTIWTALLILMTVCVCVDSGLTVFSGIQVFELVEDIVYIAFPSWHVWSVIFGINLPLEIIGVLSTNRYPLARGVMYVHAGVKVFMLTARITDGPAFWTAHYLNQAFILVLLFESVRSFFIQRSSDARRNAPSRSRSTSETTTSSSKPRHRRELAFIRGLN